MKSRSETTIDCKYIYMVTVSCQQKKDYVNRSMLDEVILWLKLTIDSFQILESVYENSGHYRQLHWHAIVNVKEGFRYSPFTKFGDKTITGNTYVVNWTKVYDLSRAIAYIQKDLQYKSQQQIITNNWYSINRFNEIYYD